MGTDSGITLNSKEACKFLDDALGSLSSGFVSADGSVSVDDVLVGNVHGATLCEYKCIICLESLDGPKYTTKCGHVFHTKCLNKHVHVRSVVHMRKGSLSPVGCPVCRASLDDFDVNEDLLTTTSVIESLSNDVTEDSVYDVPSINNSDVVIGIASSELTAEPEANDGTHGHPSNFLCVLCHTTTCADFVQCFLCGDYMHTQCVEDIKHNLSENGLANVLKPQGMVLYLITRLFYV